MTAHSGTRNVSSENRSPILRRGLMKKSSFGCQQQIIIVAAGATLLHQTELCVVVWEHVNTK